MSIWTIRVLVMPKPGVNDPQGEAVSKGLRSLEFSGVQDVRAGKQLVLTMEAENKDAARELAERMCDQLLANPVTETYTIGVEPAKAEAGTA